MFSENIYFEYFLYQKFLLRRYDMYKNDALTADKKFYMFTTQ